MADYWKLKNEVAPALYSGGWRAGDKALMLQYYNSADDEAQHLSEEEAEIICEELARIEADEA